VTVAQELVPGIEESVTLATSVTQLTVPSGQGPMRSIVVWESTVDVYVVVSPTATDGGALPDSGRPKLSSSSLPIEYDVSHARFVGVAGASSGTARVEVR
jgi:hypothetical protein